MRKTGLNLGAGQHPFRNTLQIEWINIDIQPRWNPDVVTDIRNLRQFEENSVDQVVLWHCIEHFQLGEADPIIRESHRVLCQGGRLLVATPDLRALAQRWLCGEIDDYIYTVNLMGAFMGDPADTHKWNWSQTGLLKYVDGFGPWLSIDIWDGRPISGTDVSKDWWMATVLATK